MTNIQVLKDKIHRQIEEYDSSHDDNQRRMSSRKLLATLEENSQLLQEIIPNSQKFYCELRYVCYNKSSIFKFMSTTMNEFVSKDMANFISENIAEPISETMSTAMVDAMSEATSEFTSKVMSKMIHQFWDEFDKATK